MTGTVEVHNVSRGATFSVTVNSVTRNIAPGQRTRFDVGTIGGSDRQMTVAEIVKPTAGNYGPCDKPDT